MVCAVLLFVDTFLVAIQNIYLIYFLKETYLILFVKAIRTRFYKFTQKMQQSLPIIHFQLIKTTSHLLNHCISDTVRIAQQSTTSSPVSAR